MPAHMTILQKRQKTGMAGAKWMSWLAKKYSAVLLQIFSALPRRCIVNFVSFVLHNANAAKRFINFIAKVKFDIQGNFDAVVHNRLISRRQGQRRLLPLCRWVKYLLK